MMSARATIILHCLNWAYLAHKMENLKVFKLINLLQVFKILPWQKVE